MQESASALLDRFESDIRFGCHSTWIEAGRSQAGKRLCRIGTKALPDIEVRVNALDAQRRGSLLDESVLDGLRMLLGWMRDPAVLAN